MNKQFVLPSPKEYISTIEIAIETKREMNPKPKPKFWILFCIFALAIVGGYLIFGDSDKPELAPDRIKKRDKEIEGIKFKPRKHENCEVYKLIAESDGWYPCYNCGDTTMIYLKKGEIWKYGKTCIGQEKRYSAEYLKSNELVYLTIEKGTEEYCLILEKQLIYDYPLLPECQNREFTLIRPPGCKIDR